MVFAGSSFFLVVGGTVVFAGSSSFLVVGGAVVSAGSSSFLVVGGAVVTVKWKATVSLQHKHALECMISVGFEILVCR